MDILFLLFPSSGSVHNFCSSTLDLMNNGLVCVRNCKKVPLHFNLLVFKLGSYYSFALLRVNQLNQRLGLYVYRHAKHQFDVTKIPKKSPTINYTKNSAIWSEWKTSNLHHQSDLWNTKLLFPLFVSVYNVTPKSV